MRFIPIALLLVSASAFPQGYVGGGLGPTSANISDCGIQGFSCTTNDTSTGFKLFAGYEANKNVAFEGGYVNFGQFSQSASGFVNGTRFDAKANIDGDGFFADLVLSSPISSSVSFFGRIGMTSWNVSTKAHATGGGRSASSSNSSSGVSPDYGIGVKVAITPKVSIRGELQRFSKIGDNATTGQSDVDFISVSGLYRF